MIHYALVLILSSSLALPTAAEPRESESGTLNIAVDPRIELLAVVQLLSGYGEMIPGVITGFDFDYKREMLEYFEPHKYHKAVKLFKEMAPSFHYDAPPAAMLHLSNPPELEVRYPFTEYLIRRAGGEERLEDFIDALWDFGQKSAFMEFFEAHQKDFDRMAASVRAKIKGLNFVSDIEDYYGMSSSSYNLILAPLFHPGGYGPRVRLPDGTHDVFYIGGPRGLEGNFPVWGGVEDFRYLVWHEFSHSFVNPTTHLFIDEVDRYAGLLDPIAGPMEEMAYGSWETCVNEHVVRAVTVRLAHLHQGEDVGEKSLMHERTRHFAYVEALCERLKIYEKKRDRYPCFIDFYPELIKVFKELSEADLGEEFYKIPFPGTMNGVYSDKEAETVYIVPTAESDGEVQEKIREYARGTRDRFRAEARLLTDVEALKEDLAGKAVFAYGTIDGNLWLKKNFSFLKDHVKPDRIITDRTHVGSNLRFLTARPSPFDKCMGVAIYTAQRAEDVVGINGLYHGPTDYVVARGSEVLQAADYVKKNEAWTFDSR